MKGLSVLPHFKCVFSVCQSTHIGVPVYKGLMHQYMNVTLIFIAYSTTEFLDKPVHLYSLAIAIAASTDRIYK